MILPVFRIADDVPGELLELTASAHELPWMKLIAVPLLVAGLLMGALVLGASPAWLWAEVGICIWLWGRELQRSAGRWTAFRIDRTTGRLRACSQVLMLEPAVEERPIDRLSSALLSFGPAQGRSVLLPVTLELQFTDGACWHQQLHVEALDRPDEAFDLAFRMAHALGFRGYAIRCSTAERTELELLRELEGARSALPRDPYREPARAPLAGGLVATPLPTLEQEAAYSVRRAPPPPFEPKRLDSPFVVTAWVPRRRLVLANMQVPELVTRTGPGAPDRLVCEVVFDGDARQISFATPMARRSVRFADVEALAIEILSSGPGQATARLSAALPGRDEVVLHVRPALDAPLALHKILPLAAELGGWLGCPLQLRQPGGEPIALEVS